MKGAHGYERILHDLQELRTEVEQRVRPAARQVVDAEVDQLLRHSEQYRMALKDCLARLDNSIKDCREHWVEFENKRTELVSLNDRLVTLGIEPCAMDDFRPMANFSGAIIERLQTLKNNGEL